MASSALDLLFKIKASDEASSTVKKLRSNIASDVKAIETSSAASFGQVEKSVTGSTTAMSGFAKAGPLAAVAVVGAFAAIAGAAIGVGIALFNLSKESAEFGSKIFDASQKTAFGAETLSALRVAAEQSGSTFEAATTGIIRFERAIAEAEGGNKKLSATFKQLGIDTKAGLQDPEAAFKQFIANFNKLEGDAAKTALATKLFGRAGAELIPTFETIGGSMDDYTERMRKLGLVMSDEAARRADEFGDTLKELGLVASALGRQFTNDFAPSMIGAMKDIQNALLQNQEEWRGWGYWVSRAIDGARIAARAFAIWMSSGGMVSWDVAELAARTKVLADNEKYKLGETTVGGSITGRTRAGVVGGTGGGGGADKAQQEANQALADAVRDAERLYKADTANAKREREQNLLSLRDFTAEVIRLENERFTAEETALNNRIALAKKESDKAKFRDEIETKRAERDRNVTAAQDDQDNKEIASLEAHLAELMKIYEDFGKRKIASVNRFAAAGKVSYEQAAQTELDITTNIFNRRLEILARQEEAAGEDHELRVKINDQLRALNQEQEAFQDEHNAKMEEARVKDAEREQAKLDESLERQRKYLEAKAKAEAEARQRRAEQAAADEAGAVPDFFQGLFGTKSVEEMTKTVSIMTTLGGMMQNVFMGIAQAVGQAVKSFVLFGNIGTSFRKFAAEVIASVAQMAAVQAVWELAQALAMTALAWFTGNPKFALAAGAHYAAAAFYGAIAGVAALAGRAVAGNAFQAQGAGGSSGGGSAGGGGTGSRGYEAPTTNVIEQDRNQSWRKDIYIHLETDEHSIVRAFERDVRGNGTMRQMLVLKGEV